MSKRTSLWFTISLTLSICLSFLSGCDGAGDGGSRSPVFDGRAYFPLQPGDTWNYNATAAGGQTYSETHVVGASTTVFNPTPTSRSFVVYPVLKRRSETADTHTDNYLVDRADGLRYVSGMDNRSINPPQRADNPPPPTVRITTAWYDPPITFIPDSLTRDQILSQNVQDASKSPMQPTTYLIRFDGLVSVTVPAGKFDDCAQVAYSFLVKNGSGEVLQREDFVVWLAPNVGPIKYLAGTTTLELTSAVVGGKNYGQP